MFNRLFVHLCKRTLLFFLLVCIGCSAQLAPGDLSQRIERQLRATYNVPPDVKVTITAPRASEFPNYDAITVTFDGQGKKQQYDFLVSKDQKTLVRMTKMDLTKDPYQENISKLNIKGRPVRGNANAKVVVVNFDDLQCPYCAELHKLLFPELLKEYGDRVAFVYKDFPLADLHPWAMRAAVDANCLAAQNGDAYWEFADYVHSNQRVINSEKSLPDRFSALDRAASVESDKFHLDSGKLQACMMEKKNEDAVNASVKEGEALNVSGTPTMFINGEMLEGAHSVSEVRNSLDAALQRAGVAPPSHSAAASESPKAAVGATTNDPPKH